MATTSRPQFSLLAILIFISLICLELAVTASHTFWPLGLFALPPTVFGGVGYALGKTNGLVFGVLFGIPLAIPLMDL